MPQLFHRSMTTIGRVAVFGSLFALAAAGPALTLYYRSYYVTGAHLAYDQPVPFSHQHHVGQLGLDCRYCHTSVEESSFAGIPPTKVCMNCHQQIWVGTAMLAPVRESYRTGESIHWQRVHRVPGFAYFDHSVHIAKGVGCVTCHGQVDGMPLTWQTRSLLMEWCIQCHRDPAPNLRPTAEVFSMTWQPAEDRRALGRRLADEYHIRGPEFLTSCSVCHR